VILILNRFAVAPIAALFLFAVATAHAQPLTVSSYSYIVGPDGLYPDTGGIELTDGVDQTIAWGQGISINFDDVQPLSGWRQSDAAIEFSFSSVVSIGSVRVWAADSDSAAGVALPSTVTIRTPDFSFTRTLNVVNPAGDGSTIPLDLTGFSVNTDTLIVEVGRDTANTWTMLSEVQFTAAPVPEPSTTLMALAGIASVAAWRFRSGRRPS